MLRIRELRLENGISQKELAAKFSMSQGNLCDWEKGRTEPNIGTLIAMADFFGVSVDYLVGRTDYDIPCSADVGLTAEQISLIEKIKHADSNTISALTSVVNAINRK